MTTKSLRKLAELLNRREGMSLTPIIVLMVIMSIMGGVFTSIMGSWKISAPMTINSNKAFFQAETAAMFALQDASYRFFSRDSSGCPNYPACGSGTRSTPYVVSTSVSAGATETAEFWIERPFPSSNNIVDEYPPGTDRGNNDDDTSGDEDDDVDDDADDASNPTLYSIIATGKVIRDAATVTSRQIKILTDVISSPANTVAPGVQTNGGITGTIGGFGMQNDGGTLITSFGVGTDVNTGPDPETGIVIRPPDVYLIDENFVKALADSQGHKNDFNLTVDGSNDDYPEPATPSFYYNGNFPNFTYVGQNLTVDPTRKAHGVIWVKGNVDLNDTGTMNAIIICEGNINFNGNNSNIVGGIIHYGSIINGNTNANAITVNDAFFSALSVAIPIVTVQSWQEVVAAN